MGHGRRTAARPVELVASSPFSDEYIDAGDKLIVAARSHGIARASRLEMDQRLAFVWTVRAGKLVRK